MREMENRFPFSPAGRLVRSVGMPIYERHATCGYVTRGRRGKERGRKEGKGRGREGRRKEEGREEGGSHARDGGRGDREEIGKRGERGEGKRRREGKGS
jgi:hypothetical protein